MSVGTPCLYLLATMAALGCVDVAVALVAQTHQVGRQVRHPLHLHDRQCLDGLDMVDTTGSTLAAVHGAASLAGRLLTELLCPHLAPLGAVDQADVVWILSHSSLYACAPAYAFVYTFMYSINKCSRLRALYQDAGDGDIIAIGASLAQ